KSKVVTVRHLFVTQDFPPDLGGMARRHVELCRRLAPAPDQLIVSTVSSTQSAAFDRDEPYDIARLPFSFSQAKRFTRQIEWASVITTLASRGVDLIHLGNVRPCGYAVALASRRVRVPYLVYVNGGDLLRERDKTARSAIKRWSARDILGRASGIVANSRWTAELAEDVMQRVGVRTPPPVAAIDLGTDPLHFTPARDRRALRLRFALGDALVMLTVARLVPHKGQDVAMRAMALLSDGPPDLRYLVVGEGHDLSRLRALAESLGVADRVVFAGTLNDEEVAEAYATADVYVGLSRLHDGINVEGFGISFVEASSSGTPSVAGDSGGVRSAVRDGETGLVVAPDDAHAVANALGTLLSDPALRQRMAAAGRRAVEQHYNWDRVANETRAFSREALERWRANHRRPSGRQ
ncbi:MAG: glycosyltransferase family 4 protein, partial [Gemmatimonadaceae bacterium]